MRKQIHLFTADDITSTIAEI